MRGVAYSRPYERDAISNQIVRVQCLYKTPEAHELNEMLDVDDFYLDSSSALGVQSYCKVCARHYEDSHRNGRRRDNGSGGPPLIKGDVLAMARLIRDEQQTVSMGETVEALGVTADDVRLLIRSGKLAGSEKDRKVLTERTRITLKSFHEYLLWLQN